MNRLEKKFAELQKLGKKAFIAYITAGDPSLDSTVKLVREFEKQGVDCIELGVPFSDPIADGPVNQEAAMRALRNPIGIRQILDAVREIRRESGIPIIFFAYYNSILSFGLEQFVPEAKKCGLDGALILDLPPEEAGNYKSLMDENELATVFLVSPVTPDERLILIARYATGFIYYVSQMGVTGERDSIGESIPDMVARIRKVTDIPVAVGFGISQPEHVIEIARYADGVIVGSSIVRRIGEYGEKSGFEKEVGQFVGSLTKPLGKAG